MPRHSPAVHQKFTGALDALVEQIKEDRSVLAAMLCGSLSHDTVWARSDIDLVLITIDDRQVEADKEHGVALWQDDVNIHALRMTRTEFRKAVEGSAFSSFTHAFLAKGRLLYTHDPTIADLVGRLKDLGARDLQRQLLRAGTHALPSLYKAHKWLVTRGDLDYTALWILYAATALAQIEVVAAGLIADREVIPQALGLNPSFFKLVYLDLLNTKKTRRNVEEALAAADEYVASRTPALFGPVLEHLEEVREARSCTDIENYFRRNFDVIGVTTACEYLADRGLIGKASTPVRLTRKSNITVQELAFFSLGAPPEDL